MPITSFPGFEDGLDAASRRRDHFIADLNFDDDRLWVPYGETAWFQPCHFNLSTGGFTAVLKALPGTVVQKHYHVSTVHGYTLQGTWRYLEHDWIASAGSFIYEPAGESHTLVVPEDATEPAIILFVVAGALVFVGEEDGFLMYEDGFSMLELTREYYQSVGLDRSAADALIR